MILRIVILLTLVCLASCTETKKKSEDPPWAEALNAKYFGHIRGKRIVSTESKLQTVLTVKE